MLSNNLIPLCNRADLYTTLVPDKKISNMLIGSGYNGEKTLVFYLCDKSMFNFDKFKTGSITFSSFPEAYKFILDNDITVWNIEAGSYKEEIKKYEKDVATKTNRRETVTDGCI